MRDPPQVWLVEQGGKSPGALSATPTPPQRTDVATNHTSLHNLHQKPPIDPSRHNFGIKGACLCRKESSHSIVGKGCTRNLGGKGPPFQETTLALSFGRWATDQGEALTTQVR
ncbi:hypothetical protein TNIN_441061 [Trichonephila inaurata madagascariensis]|uniref:Uncharacterized protein n=1 Tax=Trichonephila inaurata madagascariensis TaxID=2747483 RepID=A0A8X6X0W7_9ARAC|nr:hypothetical protein TNIN_441061 [Trichonephila inaurata madagascariensis]